VGAGWMEIVPFEKGRILKIKKLRIIIILFKSLVIIIYWRPKSNRFGSKYLGSCIRTKIFIIIKSINIKNIFICVIKIIIFIIINIINIIINKLKIFLFML